MRVVNGTGSVCVGAGRAYTEEKYVRIILIRTCMTPRSIAFRRYNMCVYDSCVLCGYGCVRAPELPEECSQRRLPRRRFSDLCLRYNTMPTDYCRLNNNTFTVRYNVTITVMCLPSPSSSRHHTIA